MNILYVITYLWWLHLCCCIHVKWQMFCMEILQIYFKSHLIQMNYSPQCDMSIIFLFSYSVEFSPLSNILFHCQFSWHTILHVMAYNSTCNLCQHYCAIFHHYILLPSVMVHNRWEMIKSYCSFSISHSFMLLICMCNCA